MRPDKGLNLRRHAALVKKRWLLLENHLLHNNSTDGFQSGFHFPDLGYITVRLDDQKTDGRARCIVQFVQAQPCLYIAAKFRENSLDFQGILDPVRDLHTEYDSFSHLNPPPVFRALPQHYLPFEQPNRKHDCGSFFSVLVPDLQLKLNSAAADNDTTHSCQMACYGSKLLR
jgi:hypothetical protein